MSRTDDLTKALRQIVTLHEPGWGQGYGEAGYGAVDPACAICGTQDEYAVSWPCRTIQIALDALGDPPPDYKPSPW